MTKPISEAQRQANVVKWRANLKAAIEKRQATMSERYGMHGNAPVHTIRMVVSPWYRDTDGCLTRTIKAAD